MKKSRSTLNHIVIVEVITNASAKALVDVAMPPRKLRDSIRAILRTGLNCNSVSDAMLEGAFGVMSAIKCTHHSIILKCRRTLTICIPATGNILVACAFPGSYDPSEVEYVSLIGNPN